MCSLTNPNRAKAAEARGSLPSMAEPTDNILYYGDNLDVLRPGSPLSMRRRGR